MIYMNDELNYRQFKSMKKIIEYVPQSITWGIPK